MTAISQAPGAHGLVVIFTIDEQKFGLDISAIERVIRVVEVTPLPDAPPGVIGIVNLQGQVIPVFDLRLRFHFPAREMQLTNHLLIARASGRVIALLVDAVIGVAEWNPAMVVPGAEILPGFDAVAGVVKLDGDIVLIHDSEKFLTPEEASRLEAAIATR
jgi:purine-binding chemotaxis protein CheW